MEYIVDGYYLGPQKTTLIVERCGVSNVTIKPGPWSGDTGIWMFCEKVSST